MADPTGPRKARHLIDFDAPRPAPDPEAQARLERVRRWVMSSLALTTIAHLAAGLVIAALFVEDAVAAVGLVVIATAFGVLAVVSALLIHGRSALSPWLAAGLLPGVVGWILLSR